MARGRINQGTATAVRFPPPAVWEPGHQFVPLSFLPFFAFSDLSASPHSTGTKGARWRGDSIIIANGARGLFAPGITASRLHKACSASHRAQPEGKEPRHGYEDWTVCRAEEFTDFSYHIYHFVSSGKCNEPSRTGA